MHKRWIAMLLMTCVMGGTARAQTPLERVLKPEANARVFLPIYLTYIKAIRLRGVTGLKEMTTPDFALHWGTETVHGKRAYDELHKVLADPKEDPSTRAISIDDYIVKLRRIRVNGNRAVVDTEETIVFSFVDPQGNGSATWYWTHIWRKTAGGWRLARWEKSPDKLAGPPSEVTYTLKWSAIQPATNKTVQAPAAEN